MARTVPVPERRALRGARSRLRNRLLRPFADAATRGQFKRLKTSRGGRRRVAVLPSLRSHISGPRETAQPEAELTRYVLGIADARTPPGGATSRAPWLSVAARRRCLTRGRSSYWRPSPTKATRATRLTSPKIKAPTYLGRETATGFGRMTPGSTRKSRSMLPENDPRLHSYQVMPIKAQLRRAAELAEHLIERYRAVVGKIDSPP
jgi:hypothetical protein